ncbi:hypothetical protein GCM10011575_35670 [Microlunatus endophyticus]|uniref:DUF1707 domain-containing protein n=1 Tax=Microlunatus endophyticus TaxID=1716077 RepID=A0A917W7V7_9ACTN|nr:DUF1707 domain-containing protein [Microlunatus endophyticus]GGL74280.1 hypothetical protein GCM10011575_35670 [Microlunatus endophyticus]
MSSSFQTPGTVRIGDRERDQATECLREHMAAGRLDPVEFDHRIETALTARYAEDLQPLFVDLPAPRPDLPTVRSEPAPQRTVVAPPAPKPTESIRSSAGWRTASALAWAAAIIVCFASSWNLWWVLFVPLLMGGCGGAGHDRRQRRLAARQQRWDGRTQRFEVRMNRLDQRFEHRHW